MVAFRREMHRIFLPEAFEVGPHDVVLEEIGLGRAEGLQIHGLGKGAVLGRKIKVTVAHRLSLPHRTDRRPVYRPSDANS
jgi:hypothetical protein